MLIDIHVHTSASPCSRLRLDEIMEHAAGHDLDGVCITDHHSVQAMHRIDPGPQPNGLRIFIGEEYTTDQGDFLIFGPERALPPGLAAPELLSLVDHLGGAAVAAHPFRPGRSVSESIVRTGLCRIVESVNGRNSDAANRQIGLWRSQYPLIECAGSDAHSLEELGKTKTRFRTRIDSTADLVRALKNGHCAPAAAIACHCLPPRGQTPAQSCCF